MVIVDRKTFLALPAGVVYSKYEPCVFGALEIKGDSTPSTEPRDFFSQQIADAVDASGSDDMSNILFAAEKTGGSFSMDLDCEGRDGLYDEEQLFAVWERDDVKELIRRLAETL